MKNKLLATLLTLTAIPFFAVEQQPSKTELLAHLKSVRVEIFNDIIVMDETPESILGLNLLNEFYNSSTLLQQDISTIVNDYFALLCNMAPYSQLFYIPMNQKAPFITDAEEKDLYRLFKSIYTKLHQDYCKNNPNGELVNATHDVFKDETVIYKPIIHELIIRTHGLIWPKVLIEKIDAKIVELEQA